MKIPKWVLIPPLPIVLYLGIATGANTQFYRAWPDGVIPYVLDPSLPYLNRIDAINAMGQWSKAGVRFVEASDLSLPHVVFRGVDKESWCRATPYSAPFLVRHDVTLNEECLGAAAHEIGHVLGLPHEHQRIDAPFKMTYVWSYWWKERKKIWPYFFDLVPYARTRGLPYDPLSTMHYGSSLFLNKDGSKIPSPDDPSPHDLEKVRAIYKR